VAGIPIILDWRKIRGSESLSTISNISINGIPIGYRRPRPANAQAAPGTAPEVERDWVVLIEAPADHLIFRSGVRLGENVIQLDFTSPILTSGSAITRYIDKEDGAEYIYSLFVPSDASTAFPVFDQPDLKARFEVSIKAPNEWETVSNTEMRPLRIGGGSHTPDWGKNQTTFFLETKPISTYVFAFAAGPFERVEDMGRNLSGSEGVQRDTASNSNALPTIRISAAEGEPPALAGGQNAAANSTPDAVTQPGVYAALKPPAYAGGSALYVRKSQAAKFKPHAAEVFRLNREGIKFLESYFDYKFPFPKYDLVLIPEFPFGGMEHAGATFLRESSIIFPQAPTKNDYISRATLIFHEAAHQWFGDTVTMRWLDDLWLKEGFATFMAYKTLEKVMPDYNAWKVFYERVKQGAYQTDSTKGTTPIYQEINNLSAAKSAYGAIVYNKAPAFLRQAEFYLGEEKFQTAVRAFLKKHEYANAGWEDLVMEFEDASKQDLSDWAKQWVTQPGLPTIRTQLVWGGNGCFTYSIKQSGPGFWRQRFRVHEQFASGTRYQGDVLITSVEAAITACDLDRYPPLILFSNFQDHGYGIFLLDAKSRDYVLKNIGSEKDDFLRSMMWGSLWDSVREGELDPKEYVELVIKNLKLETDESTIQTLLGRVSTAMRYYIENKGEPPALAGGQLRDEIQRARKLSARPPANAGGSPLSAKLENFTIDRMQNAATPGLRITYYRAFLSIASSENARRVMKDILKKSSPQSGSKGEPPALAGGQLSADRQRTQNRGAVSPANAGTRPVMSITTKDRFDIVGKLIILGDPDALKLLAELEKTETGDDAKRYAYAARAGIATAENKAKFWNDFVDNKEISESWIEAALAPFNNIRHGELALPYLERALTELPNHKRTRKIFFVNGWLGAFIGGQKSEEALKIVNQFLADNPNLDKDLRLKILENVDTIERAVRIRGKFGKK